MNMKPHRRMELVAWTLLFAAAFCFLASCAEIVSWSTVADRTAFEADQKAHIGL